MPPPVLVLIIKGKENCDPVFLDDTANWEVVFEIDVTVDKPGCMLDTKGLKRTLDETAAAGGVLNAKFVPPSVEGIAPIADVVSTGWTNVCTVVFVTGILFPITGIVCVNPLVDDASRLDMFCKF